MELKWNFQRGWGVQAKNLEWEGYGYFLEQHNPILHCEVNPRGFSSQALGLLRML